MSGISVLSLRLKLVCPSGIRSCWTCTRGRSDGGADSQVMGEKDYLHVGIMPGTAGVVMACREEGAGSGGLWQDLCWVIAIYT